MSDTEINATINVTEDVLANVDATAMSAAVIDDGDSIVVPAEVDMGNAFDAELEDDSLIDVPISESVGIQGDHRLLLHRDAANQHPMSAITGLDDAIAGINTALSSRISQVEAETADLDVDMASALLQLGDLQEQVDGEVTTWFYAAEPAMNLPPVAVDPSNPHDTGWDTAEKKEQHKGDLYYNTLSGYAYRFGYTNGEYGWTRITDSGIVLALADAARAQDTADSKRRVFYSTPYPPYDRGDLWVQGASGDILVCNTSKAAGEQYDFADWARASKYTDDSVADMALASANGKNTVYHQSAQPTGGTYKKGDTWFDTDDGYAMYTYDGALWIKEEFGNEAIADLSITNAKIANATIQYEKIQSVDAGKITVGYMNGNRIQANSIGADQITVNNLSGDGGWINLHEGTFAYSDLGESNYLKWDGEKLQIKADEFILSTGQNIIDAIESIGTYFLAGIPTPNNEPAVNWNTENLKRAHLRDVYYDTDSGKSYRWSYTTESALEDENGNVLQDDDGYDLIGQLPEAQYAWIQIDDGDIDELASRLSTAETKISQNQEQILLKANQTDLSLVSGRLDTAEATIALQSDAIALKADASTTYTKTEINSKFKEGLNIRTVFTDTNVTLTATVILAGVDVTGYYEDGDFEWFYRNPSGDVFVKGDRTHSYGKTITIPKTDMTYGQSVICIFTKRAEETLEDENGNALTDDNDEAIIVYAEVA